jgi:hypothetical protein
VQQVDCGGKVGDQGTGSVQAHPQPPTTADDDPAQANIRSRSRRGPQRRATSVNASIAVQASSSQARATISHQDLVVA